ncbi:17410_t:CDS:2 [Funneliformis geosporum]|nr:17410_t:CDS:2 [Funneliformis geosporum]
MKNRWMSELEMIKQNPRQSVSDYVQKFKMLMQRVDTTGGFGQHYIISKFVRGLSPHLMTMVVGHNELRAKIQNQLVKSPIKYIEEAKPYFRILANTAESEEKEYEDKALFETDLFQLKNENEIHSDLEIDKNELECIEWSYNT